MLDAEKNVPASDVLIVSNESQSDSKGEDLKNARSESEDQLNSKSQPEAHNNVVLEIKPPTIDAGMDDMVSGYVKVIDDEVQNIEKMIYEVNQNGNDLMVDRQEDSQMKTIPTNVITDSSIGKTPESASLMFPGTANAGHHSGEASENIYAMMADSEDDEGSPEDQAAFIGKLGTFYREKAMELKLPKFYGHPLNCLKLWRFVIKLGGYDRVTGWKLWRQVGDSFNPPKTCTTIFWTFRGFYEKLLLPYERHMTQNRDLQLPITAPPISWGGSGYQISTSRRVVRDSVARCWLGWQEQHLLCYGEVAEPIVKDMNANNIPKRAKSLKNSGKINDSFEVYALVPGLLQDEVQSDPVGRLVITGQPNKFDNLWGVVTLPTIIDQLRTNANVTLHGCLHEDDYEGDLLENGEKVEFWRMKIAYLVAGKEEI
ncbi:hypothetical protein H5410_060853 [Solanum commersonii]|uniref:ARID domain-containing protein n=1 Tax=Solanum commersonii TaxID=4109 RepID=A0A9J5W6W3_SOLCO|nr:hypothetical protein H5410_060853 [Solanum commersonii]